MCGHAREPHGARPPQHAGEASLYVECLRAYIFQDALLGGGVGHGEKGKHTRDQDLVLFLIFVINQFIIQIHMYYLYNILCILTDQCLAKDKYGRIPCL